MPSDDAAQFLAGSSERLQLLLHLVDQPGSPAELANELPLSRRSIQRHLSQFVEREWAAKSDGVYQPTVTGELVAEEHTTYLDTLEHIETFSSFYGHLPDRGHTPEPRWVDTAALATATTENPQAPVQHYLDHVREFDTDHIRMVSPVLSRMFHNAHAELAMDGVHTELVMSSTTIERARELNPTEFKLVVSVDVLDLYRYSGSISFGLTLGDNRILMGAYDDDGQLCACVASTNSDFCQWGQQLFERYRDQADKIEPSFSLPFTLGDVE